MQQTAIKWFFFNFYTEKKSKFYKLISAWMDSQKLQ